MSQLIAEQTTIDEANEVKLLQERLTDGSKTYNILIDHSVIFYCEDLKEAQSLFDTLSNTDHGKIH